MPKGQVRIIGGEFRGRKLKVADVQNLRPTPDRVRETLFNWLQDKIRGSYCLDAFAGSGALGFEALSRGADFVTFLDSDEEVVKMLKEQAKVFNAENLKINKAIAPNDLQKPDQPFDVVFLDPPYSSDLLLKTCKYLEENNFLAADAYIYFESSDEVHSKDLPESWQILKSKKAGGVYYYLAVCSL